MNKPKISICLSHPIQYLSPLLKEMANEFDLKVYYFSDSSIKGAYDNGFGKKIKWDIPLLEGYDYEFIKNYSFSKSISNGFFQLINPGLIRHLIKDASPVIMINGWSYSSDILTILIAKLRRKKVWLRAENPLHQELRKSRLLLWIKKIILKYFIFRFIDRFLYIGTQSKKFFQYYGAKDEELIFTPYSVDNSYFHSQFVKLQDQRNDLLIKMNLKTDKKTILFCGKYIEQKRPLDLIEAFSQIDDTNVQLVMLGEGILRKRMESLIYEKGLLSNVRLTGFINQSQISKYYSIADIFVMCSGMGETWGLAVNEAMNFHLPVVISNTCGSSEDLINEGINGFIFKEGNVQQLNQSIKDLLSNEGLRMSAGKASGNIIKQFSNAIIVENLLNGYQKK